jgi:magnesium chelatase family protein
MISNRRKLSALPLDHFDLRIAVPTLPAAALQQAPDGEVSTVVRERVTLAHARLKPAVARNLSARAYHRVLKAARSVADLASTEANQYRRFAKD